MIEIKLIPDGAAEVPAEAKDHAILQTYLEQQGDVPAVEGDPIESWRDVERVVPGNGAYVALRVPRSTADYDPSTLDNLVTALESNINGLKKHPNGWTEVEQPEA